MPGAGPVRNALRCIKKPAQFADSATQFRFAWKPEN